MAQAKLQFMDRAEEDLVHQKSIEILEDIGVLVRSETVLYLLEQNGALVDRRTNVAKLPESMVREALGKAPSRFRLCSRIPENDVELPSTGIPYLTTDGLTLHMIDEETGGPRPATRKDYSGFARLADALEAISFFWPIVTISDVPETLHSEFELWDGLVNCSMHVQGDCTSAASARRQIELATLIAGGEDELRKRPIFSAATNPISPLSFDRGAVEAQVVLARAGVPILCHSMSMAGMSSPVTIAGTVANINSENLASLVITQCASPGAPHIYGSSSAPADMRTGALNYLAPEGFLTAAAAGQMARRYRRPCMVANWGVGRNGPGFNISFSEALAYMGSVLSGSDLVSGAGGLDSAKGCSMSQMVLDSRLWDNFHGFLRDFRFDEGSFAIDAFRNVGQGNSFLSSPHTRKNFRKELFMFDPAGLQLERTFSNSMLAGLRDDLKKMLKDHEPRPVEKELSDAAENILSGYAKKTCVVGS